MEAITYRQAILADLPGILSLYQIWAEEENREELIIDISNSERIWFDSWYKDIVYFIAADKDKIVSTCYVSIIPNLTWGGSSIAFMENVFTDKDYRNRGIGKKVVQMGIDYAEKSGCHKLILQSSTSRKNAHRFYNSLGFDSDLKVAFDLRFTNK
ncbi:GNAT family N-acetyltransferase [Lactococcus raffinolactis]|uniref:GNAT family N-acetyltransferase n=1 Tax=Pseudolactococcus raffinolactis TaxID=1366 RepID=UPI0039AF5487